ncbi:MAG: GH32 C-terminal domain-containing protein, partial [Muribaculaceae bacterium]|nr:GH32 C-terminal domain-containing protein [Muribaculaceae bacterium]
YQHDGKTIVLGIVPDKLPGETNHRLGWAHTYSLPREWSLDSNGNLVQRPYEGLKQMRSVSSHQSVGEMSFNGRHTFDAVSGRAVEVRATFEAGSAPFGVSLFGNAHGEGVISFNPATRMLTADFSTLNRISNDSHLYNGVYTAILPENVLEGGEVTLDVYVDHSVVDIFVNDRWATSIRVFPNDTDADGVALWSSGDVKVKSAEAWRLESDGGAGISSVTASPLADNRIIGLDGTVWGLSSEGDTTLLPKGVYIIDGKTRVIK